MFKRVICVLGVICVIILTIIGFISIENTEDTFVRDNLVNPLRWGDGTEADYTKVKYKVYEGSKYDYYNWFEGRTHITEHGRDGTDYVLKDPSELVCEDDGNRIVILFPLTDDIYYDYINNYDWFELRFLYYNF